ncbi:MAG: holo-ACP synthase [Phycisphaerales bacterium]|nr:holo-ACP synthase [Phycisphaerales bacterium]
MKIVGHGVDLVETARIAALLESHGERFTERCFTPSERAYAASAARRQSERFAARFAAKEAVLKALGTGLRSGMSWHDIEVVRDPAGRPGLRLAGRCLEVAESLGASSWHLSLTHTSSHAMASVIASGPAPDSA